MALYYDLKVFKDVNVTGDGSFDTLLFRFLFLRGEV
jgi:hypothetical protein